jgi:ParB/RepB/Spo0J family partition protein
MSTFRVVPLSSLSAPEAPLRHAMERESLDDLCRSIATLGLLQPITVKEAPNGYEVVAGHRRLLACRAVGLAEVPVMLRQDDAATQAQVMLAENLERVDLNPVEEARTLQRGRDVLGLSIEELSRRANRSEAWVRGRLELLVWPAFALEALASGVSSVAALKPLMEIDNEVERDRLLVCAIDAGATAAVTRGWAAQALGFASASPETLSGRSAALVGLNDVAVHMPCFACRVPQDAFKLQVLRVCRPCIDAFESVAAQPPEATGAGG